VAEAVVRLRVDASGATRALNGVQNRTNQLQNSFNGLRTAIATTGITLLARQAVNTSANFEKLNVRLGLLTKESGSFAKSQKIASDAQKAFGLSATEALEGVTDITARLAPLKVGVEDIRTVFFGFNTAAKLAGASTIEASNAFRQLAQALGSGRLAGDEFRSVSEQVPTILAPIADELGVNIGELKKFAAEGKLTSDVVLRALGRVGKDGSEFLQQLLKNDPTQVFKDFNNATEDLSRAFGDSLRPAVEAATKALTEFVKVTTDFINSPAGQAAFILAGTAFAAKAVAVALPLVSAGLIKVAAAGGIATIALNAIPFVAVATGIGAIVTQLIKQRNEQNKVTEAIQKGELAQLRALEADLGIKMAKEIGIINDSNDKRTIAAAERRLALLREQMIPIRERLDEKIKENAELEKTNKLKEESIKKDKELKKALERQKEIFEQIGESIATGISDALTDAAMGAKTLGEAAVSVLQSIGRQLIQLGINTLLFNLFGGASGIFKNLPTFAAGGKPPVGRPSIVGEKGPELFVPTTAGTIIPNNQLGGGVVNNINVSVDASGSSVEGDTNQSSQLGRAISEAIQLELVKQQRAGGLLYR